ncbi:MAG: hypothetical protein NTZ94_15795 [Verrucomicrobia bacterium]|nr:hypothetical protein [Verrucomicrobiota bacterium]
MKQPLLALAFLAVTLTLNASLYGQGFSEPYCGEKEWEKYTPTPIDPSSTKLHQGIGKERADELAKIFGIEKRKCLSSMNFLKLISGSGVSGNMTETLILNVATNWFINSKDNPIICNIDGVPTPIVLGSYGLMVNENGKLQSLAQDTSPCREANELLAPGGYLPTWFKANGAEDSMIMFWASKALRDGVIYGSISQTIAEKNAELVEYKSGVASAYVGMSMIPPIWIVNFIAVYVLDPDLAALMPAYWTPIPKEVKEALIKSKEGQVDYKDFKQYLVQ